MAETKDFVLIPILNGTEASEMLEIDSSITINSTTGSINNILKYFSTIFSKDGEPDMVTIQNIIDNTVVLYGAPENQLEITSELDNGCFNNVPGILKPYLNKVSFYFPFREGSKYEVNPINNTSLGRFIDITINSKTILNNSLKDISVSDLDLLDNDKRYNSEETHKSEEEETEEHS